MTLITNEIHVIDNLSRSFMIFAADRRITIDGHYDSTRKKLFKVEYLNSYLSYFGLAQVYPKGRKVYLSEWLPNFIKNQTDVVDLAEFAGRLRDALNTAVPAQVLASNASGFHLAGYHSNGYPDFYYFSNIGRIDQFQYVDLHQRYDKPASHFLGRDALKEGWDGKNPSSISNVARIYRNGDIRGHVVAWEKLDEILDFMFQFEDFEPPTSIEGYEVYVKTKIEMIAYLYKKFAKKKIIARPIDVFSLHNP